MASCLEQHLGELWLHTLRLESQVGLQELALRDFLYLSWDLMMITFLPTFKLFFFSSSFLVLCFAALSVVRVQYSQ